MSAKRILTGLMALGLALCVLGVVFVGNGVRCHFIPVRDAEVVEIVDTGYIHGAGDDIRNEYTEDVAVNTEDGESVKITVKSMDEHTLPGVGETIRIYGSKEYTSWYEKVGIWFVYGIICIVFGVIILRKLRLFAVCTPSSKKKTAED